MSEIQITKQSDLLEALDAIHTQVMDRFGEESPMLRILETAMDAVSNLEEHQIVADVTSSGYPRLTCIPCQQQTVRQRFLSENGWTLRCAYFYAQHPDSMHKNVDPAEVLDLFLDKK